MMGRYLNVLRLRKAPHNSYITYENILKGAKQNKYSMEKSPAPI